MTTLEKLATVALSIHTAGQFCGATAGLALLGLAIWTYCSNRR